MRILAALDSIFRQAAEGHEPWFPEPDRSVYYMDDKDWQKHHLWDHYIESDNGAFGPYRGPTVLNHPDLQHALDNGWRVYGGDKSIDHQSRGETGSGTKYLYKIDENGLLHSAHLGVGPDELEHYDDDDNNVSPLKEYGSVPESNYRHLISGEGGATSEGPEMHDTLRDLVDDEQRRSTEPGGYKDFAPLPAWRGRRSEDDLRHDKQYQHSVRRAWQTGTNDHSKHWNDPIEDAYADIDKIPKNQRRAADDQVSG